LNRLLFFPWRDSSCFQLRDAYVSSLFPSAFRKFKNCDFPHNVVFPPRITPVDRESLFFPFFYLIPKAFFSGNQRLLFSFPFQGRAFSFFENSFYRSLSRICSPFPPSMSFHEVSRSSFFSISVVRAASPFFLYSGEPAPPFPRKNSEAGQHGFFR